VHADLVEKPDGPGVLAALRRGPLRGLRCGLCAYRRDTPLRSRGHGRGRHRHGRAVPEGPKDLYGEGRLQPLDHRLSFCREGLPQYVPGRRHEVRLGFRRSTGRVRHRGGDAGDIPRGARRERGKDSLLTLLARTPGEELREQRGRERLQREGGVRGHIDHEVFVSAI
jgi:hypothetical protein